ncbi:ANTAR domain-containing protein [Lentzea xinjiangensis]|uniref:ANTAR domain-containing protein n=1 Tax=Lentzea xinjiangensis TaxID=402600 RepID=A0A1H9PDG6_9PSEU|nr:ANTAR domain-containing protein [Lentzea xinjiangensis]SER46192.1 ANTAR domain-containing protein [Lentzea xinjiangensis]
MDGQRRNRFERMIADRAAGSEWPAALCAVCVEVLPGVDAAALVLRGDARAQEVVSASDPWAVLLEELQYTLGEGPGVQAGRGGGPVLVRDVHAEQARWPGFAAAAAEEGLAAVFAFPLQVGGIRLGTLDLYRRRPGSLPAEGIADAAVLADLAVLALLENELAADEDELRVKMSYQDVHLATGVLAAKLRIGLDDAFARLRAHAFAERRSLLDVSRDVLDQRISPDRLAD